MLIKSGRLRLYGVSENHRAIRRQRYPVAADKARLIVYFSESVLDGPNEPPCVQVQPTQHGRSVRGYRPCAAAFRSHLLNTAGAGPSERLAAVERGLIRA